MGVRMFHYQAVFRNTQEDPPAGLIVVEGTRIGTQALIWDWANAIWQYDPAKATLHLHETDSWTELDRAMAEEFSRTSLGTELPSEETLHRMCGEGEAARFRPQP